MPIPTSRPIVPGHPERLVPRHPPLAQQPKKPPPPYVPPKFKPKG